MFKIMPFLFLMISEQKPSWLQNIIAQSMRPASKKWSQLQLYICHFNMIAEVEQYVKISEIAW